MKPAIRRLGDRLGASLRARLTLAFGSIIVVTLLLAGSAFVFILQDYQIRRETNRVAELTLPISNQVRSMEQLGATQQEIVDFLSRQADELDLRMVLADARGLIFADSDDSLVGRQLQVQNPGRFGIQRRVRQATVQGPEGEITFMISPTGGGPVPQNPAASPSPVAGPPPGASIGERFLGRASAYLIGLSIPRQTLATAWLELLPRLSLAALGALLLSIAIAWPLAASIARPLASMTQAAERIAQGRFERPLEVRGRDEVARLGQSFNHMARAVSASQRTLRDLLANVSHDLRTPLTSIHGFSQALTDGTLATPGEVAEAGRIISQEAARMSQLIEDLLYLSKMESGQAELELRELDLQPLVTSRIETATRRAAEARIELLRQTEPAPTVLADPLRLERVIDNLLDNALRHTPPGGTVTVRLSQAAGDGRRAAAVGTTSSAAVLRLPPAALVSVHNTGSVIPADDLPRVFERFFQVDKSRAVRFADSAVEAGGSGLGLAISREIVLAHGGRCWAESSPDAGTSFFVLLPGRSGAQPSQSGSTQRPVRATAVVVGVGPTDRPSRQ